MKFKILHYEGTEAVSLDLNSDILETKKLDLIYYLQSYDDLQHYPIITELDTDTMSHEFCKEFIRDLLCNKPEIYIR